MEEGSSMHVRFSLLRVALVLTILTADPYPAKAEEAHAPMSDPASLIVVMLTPLTKIYEGDTVSISYFVEQPGSRDPAVLAPLTPGKASITAQRGNASVAAQGMSGTITYTAMQAGRELLTLSVDLGSGNGTGIATTGFTVYPKGNYTLTFMLVNEADQQGAGFREVISGNGSFTNLSGQPLQGTGKMDAWFVVWANTQAFDCKMNPPVTGSTFFDIRGTRGAVGRRGFPFTLDFVFQPLSTNASTINCLGLGDITVDLPFPAVEAGDINVLNLTGLKFPAGGGRIRINRSNLWGAIYALRK